MIELPFTKLHGDENDFIISWADQSPQSNWPEISRRICARTTGIGADGWMLAWPEAGGLRTRLFNSDGTEAEISGNGTRCAAVFALLKKAAAAPNVDITTAAGKKSLRVIKQEGHRFLVEIRTPAGNLKLRWDESVFLTGPAELIGEGTYCLDL